MFDPALGIVEEIMKKNKIDKDQIAIPVPSYVAHQVNRHRQKFRPQKPRGFDFEVKRSVLPARWLMCLCV